MLDATQWKQVRILAAEKADGTGLSPEAADLLRCAVRELDKGPAVKEWYVVDWATAYVLLSPPNELRLTGVQQWKPDGT